MHLKQMQKASCYTAPLVCDLSVCTSQAVVWEAGYILFYIYICLLYIYIYMPLCTFAGLFNTLLGILTERLALLTIISVGVSEWAVLLGCLQMYNGAS